MAALQELPWSKLDVPIEPLDPLGAARRDLCPVLIAEAAELGRRLGDLLGDPPLIGYLAVGRDDVKGPVFHIALDLGREMRVDVLHGKLGLLGALHQMQAGAPGDPAALRNSEL